MSNPEFVRTLLTQIGIMLVVFLFNVAVLRSLVFKPTLKILSERRKKFEDLNAESKVLQERIAVQWSQYEGRLEEARQMARKAREDILREAEKERQNLLSSARAQAEKQLADARADLARDVATAKADLQKTTTELADRIVAKILNQKAA